MHGIRTYTTEQLQDFRALAKERGLVSTHKAIKKEMLRRCYSASSIVAQEMAA
jgi:hypothetical protein